MRNQILVYFCTLQIIESVHKSLVLIVFATNEHSNEAAHQIGLSLHHAKKYALESMNEKGFSNIALDRFVHMVFGLTMT